MVQSHYLWITNFNEIQINTHIFRSKKRATAIVVWEMADIFRDYFVHVPTQWETMLHCNVFSHWLGAYTKMYTKRSLHYVQASVCKEHCYCGKQRSIGLGVLQCTTARPSAMQLIVLWFYQKLYLILGIIQACIPLKKHTWKQRNATFYAVNLYT